MKQVYILAGEIHSGKTTRLMRWAAEQKNIDGIFQPVIDEKRFIYHIGSRSLKILETEDITGIVTIGRYKFSNRTFDWAGEIILNCLKKDLDWILIDEIGPLELNGKALEPALKILFANCMNEETKIICIVRQELVEKVVEYFGIENRYTLLADDVLS